MAHRFYKIDYDIDDNVCKYIRVQETIYNGDIAESFICSWIERNFLDEICFVVNKEVDSIDLLKELRESGAYGISEKEYRRAFQEACQEIKHAYISEEDTKRTIKEIRTWDIPEPSEEEVKEVMQKLTSMLTPKQKRLLGL